LGTDGEKLTVRLTAGISPEMNVPDVSKLMQDKIKSSVRETIGREMSSVNILVSAIANKAVS
jgi:uncharacterized alkaline shock family protein YloU